MTVVPLIILLSILNHHFVTSSTSDQFTDKSLHSKNQLQNTGTPTVGTSPTIISPLIKVIAPEQSLQATIFPFRIQHGIKLQYDDSNDGIYELPKLIIQVYNGTLAPSNPFPGLFIQNENPNPTRLIEVIGPIEDIQSWIDSGRIDKEGEEYGSVGTEAGGGIRYIPPEYDWSGRAVIHLTLIGPEKEENKKSSLLPTAFAKMYIDVDPYLEMKMSIVMPGGGNRIETLEDQSFYPFLKSSKDVGITVSVNDVSRKKKIECSLEVTHGSFSLTQINGTIDAFKEELSGIEYKPEPDFNGLVKASVICYNKEDDQQGKVSFEIDVRQVNDQPEIVLHPKRVFEIWEDTEINLGPFAGLFIVDIDAHESSKSLIAVDLAISDGEGFLRLPPPEFLGGLHTTSKTTNHLRLVGYIDQVNIALQYVSLSFPQHWFGVSTLAVRCTDSIEFGTLPTEILYYKWISDSVDIVVKNINDVPIIIIKQEAFRNKNEGDTIAFKDGIISVVDVDSGFDVLNFTIEVKEVEGSIPAYFVVDEDCIHTDTATMTMDLVGKRRLSSFSIQSNITNLSRCLGSMKVQLAKNWFGICSKCIHMNVVDANGGRCEDTLSFKVAAVNDHPIINFSPAVLSLREDEEILLSDYVNFTVYDADILHPNQRNSLSMSVKSSKRGSIGLQNYLSECHITGGNPYIDPESELSFQGRLEVVRQTLNSIYYRPPANLDTSDVLHFEVTDEDMLSTHAEFFIEFIGVNDPPAITGHEVEKSLDSHGAPILKTGFDIVDPDGLDEKITLTLILQPPDAGKILCPRLKNSQIKFNMDESKKLTISGEAKMIDWISGEVLVSLNNYYDGLVSTLRAEVKDNEGGFGEDIVEIYTQMNQSVPSLRKTNSSFSSLEDTPFYIGRVIEIDGKFEESSNFEIEMSSDMRPVESYGSDPPVFQFLDLSLPGTHLPFYDVDTNGSPEKILMQGNIVALRIALKKLMLIPPINFFGLISIRFGVRSLTSSIYNDIYAFDTIYLYIKSVDDVPSIFWDNMPFRDKNPVFHTDEDSIVAFDGRLSISDVDDEKNMLSLEVRAQFGSICRTEKSDYLNTSVAVYSTDESHLYRCLKQNKTAFSGNIATLNEVLGTMAYQPNSNWWGVDNIQIDLNSKSMPISSSIRVAVHPVVDKTMIHVSNQNLTVSEDSRLQIKSISISDHDVHASMSPENNLCIVYPQHCHITVELQANNGTLSVKKTNSTLSVHLRSQQKLIIRGSLEDINDSLSSLVYEPKANFVGNDYIAIRTRNSISGSNSNGISVVVTNCNDAPKIILPEGSSFTVWEDLDGIIGDEDCINDTALPLSFITCQRIKIEDVDTEIEGIKENANTTMKLSLSTENGFIKIPRLRFTPEIISTNNSTPDSDFQRNIELEGPLVSLNWILTGMIFKGKSNFNTADSFEEIFIKVEDANGAIGTESFFIRILPINDEPVIKIVGQSVKNNVLSGDGLDYKRLKCETITVSEDEKIQVEGISIRDTDCDETTEVIEMTIFASNGTLLLGDHVVMRQWIEGESGQFSPRIQMRGTIDDLNTALKYMIYQPNSNFYGEDVIEVHVSDMGNVGFVREKDYTFKPMPLTDTAYIPVSVISVEDVTIISAPSFIKMHEDSTIVLDINLSHPDSNETLVNLSFRCNNGKVRMNYFDGITVTDGINDSSHVAAQGRVLDFQRSLNQVIFSPNENWNTKGKTFDKIIVSVQNALLHGNSYLNTTHEIDVDVMAVNDPPFWRIPGSTLRLQPTGGYVIESIAKIFVYEDDSVTISPISIEDTDLHENSQDRIKVTIKAEHGYIKLIEYDGLFREQKTFHDYSEAHDEMCLEFYATFHSTNKAIKNLIYEPLPDYHGQDAIILTAIDEEHNASVTIPIDVVSVVDLPIINAPSVLLCAEESWCEIPNVFVDDRDFNPSLIINISTSKGILAFSGELDSIFRSIQVLQGIPNGDNFFHLSGSAHDLNLLWERLAYLPVLGSSESIAIISFTASLPEEMNTALYLSSTETFIAITNSEDDHPFIRYDKVLYHDDPNCLESYRSTALAEGATTAHVFCAGESSIDPFTCFEDVNCSLRGLSTHDPDRDSDLQLFLTVTNGVLSVNDAMNLHFIERKPGHLDLRGHAADINRALESLNYMGRKNFAGKDHLYLRLLDPMFQGAASPYYYEMTIDIVVSSVEDSIAIAGPRFLSHKQREDELSIIPRISVLHEHNFPSDHLIYVSTNVHVSNGRILFASLEGLNYTIPDTATESIRAWNDGSQDSKRVAEGKWWNNGVICGLLKNINNALKEITFLGQEHTNSEVSGLAEVTINVKRVENCLDIGLANLRENDRNFDDTLSILINIEPVNDSPVVIVNGRRTDDRFFVTESLIVDEDAEINIPVHVEDIDNNILRVELSVLTSGYISVSNDTPNQGNDLYFLVGSSGNFSRRLSMEGSIDSLNSHLANMIFKGENNYNGDACVIEVKSCDSNELCDSSRIQVTISPINDPVNLYMPVDATLSRPLINVNEGDDFLLSTLWVNGATFMMEKVQVGKMIDGENYLKPLTKGRAFSISANDGNRFGSTTCLQLSVDKGFISLKDYNSSLISILNPSGTLERRKIIQMKGPIEDLNDAATKNLLYSSTEGETGHAQISVTVSREETNCEQEEQCLCDFELHDAQGFFHIFVAAVNMPPIIEWDGDTIIATKTNEVLDVGGFRIIDRALKEDKVVDSHERIFEGILTVSISVSNGVINFKKLTGLTMTKGDGLNDQMVEIMGTIDNINNALSLLEYFCKDKDSSVVSEQQEDWCNQGMTVHLRLNVDDNGFTGKGAGALQSDYEIDIMIQ